MRVIPFGIQKVFKSPLNQIDLAALHVLGTIRFEGNNVFKYVNFSGANVVAAGDAVSYTSAASENVVNGVQGNYVAGLALAAVLVAGGSQFGWIMIKGPSNTNFGNAGGTFNTSWTVPGAVGNPLTGVGAVYPALAVVAAVTSQAAAWVVATGVAGTGVVSLDCPF